jgi:hypothetical protein
VPAFAGSTAMPSASAAASTAAASGWLEPASTAAASVSSSRRSAARGTTSVTAGAPRVSVPVLSKATSVVAAAASITAPPFTSSPCRVPADRAEAIDAGTEMTSAQGQPIRSSASAR